MKTKGLQSYLYSGVGLVVMFVIIVAFNWIASHAKARLDLTAERAYTLSPGTRNILAKLDTPVQVRFYCTRGENRMPVFLKNHAQDVEDLLDEYRQVSKGRIEIQKLDPQPDSDAEDSAKLDGIEPRTLNLGAEPIYLGLSVTMLDQKETIPFLDPQAARLLEYEVSRAISRVMATERPTLGLMTPLPMAGQMNPMMQRAGRGQPPWFFYTQLKRNFNVKQIELTADKIPEDVKVLVVVHPKGLNDAAQYAIDQFVLRGGKLVAFLDPLAVLDAQQQTSSMMPPASSSSLDKLLKTWGLTFDATKVVADMNYVTRLQQGRAPSVLSLNENAVNNEDVVSAGADNLLLAFAGVFSGTPADGVKQTVLVKSSKNSQLIEPMMAQMGGESLITNFTPSGSEHPLAIRLTGRFKSAFPEGKPAASPTPQPSPGEPAPTPTPAANEPALKESSADGAVILVGDTDFLQDQLAVDEGMNPFGGQRVVIPRNVNVAFAEGAVEQLAGDANLIAVRSRATRERPFTVVKQMQADAEANYRSKIKELEASLADAQRKLNELQRTRTGEQGQRFVLSAEQQNEIANFRRKEAEVKKALKEERKRLRADIDALENRIKWANIGGMPLVVIAVGVFLALRRRRVQAAT